MRINEIWRNDNEDFTIRLVNFIKKPHWQQNNSHFRQLVDTDYVEYTVIDYTKKDVPDGDMPVSHLLQYYSKVYFP